MKSFKLSIILLCVTLSSAFAQELTYDRISTVAYEDLSDWIRRLPGLYPMDYGVAGAPMIIRPWNAHPWLLGVERDGIPWHRVSDGLYDSNLDSPEGLSSLSLRFDGSSPLGTLDLRSRSLPSDSATTEVVLREGYYGFGRIDFAHAQSFNDKVTAEARGRLFWYDGLRFETSKSRFYNLSGKLNAKLAEHWIGSVEYGGSDVDAQAPVAFRDGNIFRRPQIYSEREYGTAKVNRTGDAFNYEFGLHARQDREKRDHFFGLREKFWYGYAQGDYSHNRSNIGARLACELSDFSFPGIEQRSENAVSLIAHASHDLGFMKVNSRALHRQRVDVNPSDDYSTVYPDNSLSAKIESRKSKGLSLSAEGNLGRKSVPQFWRYANYTISHRELLIDDAFNGATQYSGEWRGFEAPRDPDEFYMFGAGVDFSRGSSVASLRWTRTGASAHRFIVAEDTSQTNADTLYYILGDGQGRPWQGPSLNIDVALTQSFRLQSWSSVATDINGIGRAIDTRSFTRIFFSRDFLKAPLHINSYVAYELIGNHDAVSDYRSYNVGPTHMLHFRVEGTIEGVTLIWGVENLTGQHYEYLPGYEVISKEEYFGMRWTLKL